MSKQLTVPFEFTHSHYLRRCPTIQDFADTCANWGANQERERIHNTIMKILSSDISFDSKINLLKVIKEIDPLKVEDILNSINIDACSQEWKTIDSWKYAHFFFLESSQTVCGIITSKKHKTFTSSSRSQCPKCKKILQKVLSNTLCDRS